MRDFRREGKGKSNEEGMEADDLLCSHNARPQEALVGRAQWKINQPPSLKRQRENSEERGANDQVPFLLRNAHVLPGALVRE